MKMNATITVKEVTAKIMTVKAVTMKVETIKSTKNMSVQCHHKKYKK